MNYVDDIMPSPIELFEEAGFGENLDENHWVWEDELFDAATHPNHSFYDTKDLIIWGKIPEERRFVGEKETLFSITGMPGCCGFVVIHNLSGFDVEKHTKTLQKIQEYNADNNNAPGAFLAVTSETQDTTEENFRQHKDWTAIGAAQNTGTKNNMTIWILK